MQNNEIGPLPPTYIIINSRWIKDLNVTVFLEENIRVNLNDFAFGKGFLDMMPKACATTTK